MNTEKNGQPAVCWSSNTTGMEGTIERLFRRTVLNNAFPVYINPAGDRFEKTLLTTYPKAYPIPDDAKLYRWC